MSNQSNYRYCNIKSLGTSSQAAIEQRIRDTFSGLKLKKILPSSNCNKTKGKIFLRLTLKHPITQIALFSELNISLNTLTKMTPLKLGSL